MTQKIVPLGGEPEIRMRAGSECIKLSEGVRPPSLSEAHNSIQLLYFLAEKFISPGTPNACLCMDFLPRDGIVDLVNKGFHGVLVTFESVDGLSGSSPKSSVVISPSPFSRSEIKEDVSRIR